MNTITSFENIDFAESATRFLFSIAVILIAMHSSFAGGTVAFVSIVTVATVYALMAIVGWCPIVALGNKLKSIAGNIFHHGDHFQHGHHA